MNCDLKLVTKVLTLLSVVLAFSVSSPSAFAQQFVTIKYPGASDSWVFGSALNNPGIVVGTYVDADGFTSGFLFSGGTYTSIAPPPGAYTNAFGVNNSKQVVGNYRDSAGVTHGFLFSGGAYTTFDPPGSVSTEADGINDTGQIVGLYEDTNFKYHGFLYSSGVFTNINFPGAETTFAWRINNLGQIAGSYVDSVGEHGFLLANEVFTTINVPNSTFTRADAINDAAQLAGTYIPTGQSATQGFVYSADNFTSVSVPSAASTYPTALSNGGVLAGYFGSAVGINCDTSVTGGLGGSCQGFVRTTGPFAYVGSGSSVNCCNITVLDTQSDLVVTTIPIGGLSYPFGITPDQTRLYVAISNAVDVIDTTTNTLVGTITGVGPGANAVTVAPHAKIGYTGNGTTNSSGSVSVFSTTNNSVVATIPLTFGAGGVSVTPDGSLLYVGGTGSTIPVISTSTNTVESTFSIAVPTAGVNGNSAPVFNSSGSLGYVAQDVASVTPGTVTVISIPSNSTVATIQVGTQPQDIALTPDGAYAYVSNVGSNNVSVINTSSNTVVATVPVGNQPNSIAITPDGAFTYVANYLDSTVSVIQTSTNSVVATIPVTSPFGDLIPSAPVTASRSITQPLSPTAPNTFNFGPHNFTVTYPPGTSFSGVNMTVVAAQNSQQTFRQRVAGTTFANATCIVYSGAGGNCVDYQVTCSTTSGSQITCPDESSPTIAVKTSYDTLQQIIDPGFLTTPIGTNDWTNIFTAFYLQRIDPTTKGRTSGFSEFVAVDLGATNGQGAGTLQFLAPLQQSEARIFPVGTLIPVQFQLTSIAQPSESITDAKAGITVVMISDANGNPTSNVVLDKSSAFAYTGGNYVYSLNTSGYAPGTYNVTVYGNAFAAQQVQFTLPAATSGAHLITTLQSLTLNTTTNQYVATINVSNTGTAAANGLIVTASSLNSTATSTVLPVSLGNISGNGSATTTLTYPASAGAAGSRGVWTISENFAGGSTGAGMRIVLP